MESLLSIPIKRTLESWPCYGDQSVINEVLREISERGGNITSVMEMEETVWENREDIHFRRFSDGTYLFPRTQTFPDSRIACVDWPNDQVRN